MAIEEVVSGMFISSDDGVELPGGLGDHAVEVGHLTALETRLARELLATWVGGLVGSIGRALVLERLLAGVAGGTQVSWSLEPLEGETTVNVPCDMAMHQPGTWVVGLEANDGVAT